MMRVVIAEDEKHARDKLARLLQRHEDVELVAACADGLEAAAAIERLQPDVAWLDIQMPGLTGLEVAAQTSAVAAPLFVFVTAFDEHAVQAFDLSAVDYLLKPYDEERLDRALQRVRDRLQDRRARENAVTLARARTQAADRLLVPEKDALKLIDAASIESLEADDNYVHVCTATQRYLLRRTLGELLGQLGEARFVRIHRSSAVNLDAVRSFTQLFKGDYEVQLASGRVLRMSRRYKDALFARIAR